MTDSFSTPAEHAFDHPELQDIVAAGQASAGNGDAAGESVEDAFEVADTVRRILEGGYTTIGLQFPDELLPSSVPVFRAIQKGIAHTGAQAYVLGDSTYGSCCPDILSCLHLPADFLVHYGHACLTPTDAIPVHYIFPRRALDVAVAGRALADACRVELDSEASGSGSGGERKGVVVVWDVAYDHLSDQFQSDLPSLLPVPVSFATIHRPAHAPAQPAVGGTSSSATATEGIERPPPRPSSPPLTPRQREKSPAPPLAALRAISPPPGLDMRECVVWYIGDGGRSLMNLQMQNADALIYHYSPESETVVPLTNTSRLLQRRLLSIHSAVASDVFGLVVHSVGLRSSQPLLAALRALLRKHRKKSYTLTVGRLNPAKLANFEAVECFVLVGCAEGGLVDSKEFLRPIITPWELLLALQGPEHAWQPEKWTLDIDTVLRAAQPAPAESANEAQNGQTDSSAAAAADDDAEDALSDDSDAPVFNLATGAYKSRRQFGRPDSTLHSGARVGADATTEGMQQLALRNNEYTLARLESAGSSYLTSRHFRGLEVRQGLDAPAVLEEGRSGVARGYAEEK